LVFSDLAARLSRRRRRGPAGTSKRSSPKLLRAPRDHAGARASREKYRAIPRNNAISKIPSRARRKFRRASRALAASRRRRVAERRGNLFLQKS
jgi:hypothetical protein